MDQLYDIAIVGGGLAGSALAKSMAERRFRVVVLELEKEFRDRVRARQIACWGVAEAPESGWEHLVNGGSGQKVRWWETRVGSAILGRRDFLKTTPQHMPQFMFYHPRMLEILGSAAREVGVEYFTQAARAETRASAGCWLVRIVQSYESFGLTKTYSAAILPSRTMMTSSPV